MPDLDVTFREYSTDLQFTAQGLHIAPQSGKIHVCAFFHFRYRALIHPEDAREVHLSETASLSKLMEAQLLRLFFNSLANSRFPLRRELSANVAPLMRHMRNLQFLPDGVRRLPDGAEIMNCGSYSVKYISLLATLSNFDPTDVSLPLHRPVIAAVFRRISNGHTRKCIGAGALRSVPVRALRGTRRFGSCDPDRLRLRRHLDLGAHTV